MKKRRRGPREARNSLPVLLAMNTLQHMLQDQPALRDSLVEVFRQLGTQVGSQAKQRWQQDKASLTAYWHAIAVHAQHRARTLFTGGGKA